MHGFVMSTRRALFCPNKNFRLECIALSGYTRQLSAIFLSQRLSSPRATSCDTVAAPWHAASRGGRFLGLERRLSRGRHLDCRTEAWTRFGPGIAGIVRIPADAPTRRLMRGWFRRVDGNESPHSCKHSFLNVVQGVGTGWIRNPRPRARRRGRRLQGHVIFPRPTVLRATAR